MPGDRPNSPEDALFERLFNALGEKDEPELKWIREAVQCSQVDPDRVVREGMKQFKNALAHQKIARARERLEHIRKIVLSIEESAAESIDQVRDQVARTLSGESTGEAYVAYHRSLQSIEREDLKSLQDDTALLDFLARLDEESRDL